MALPLKQILHKRTCLPVCELIHHISCLQIPSRSEHSVPWYQEYLQPPVRPKMDQEDRRSILRNPGVINVSKLSKEQLCQHLTENVFYKEGPLLAINKPQGLAIAGVIMFVLAQLLLISIVLVAPGGGANGNTIGSHLSASSDSTGGADLPSNMVTPFGDYTMEDFTGNSEELSMVSLLPDLQQLLQLKPELHIVKAAPKESSGLVLLSTCHVTTKNFEDFYSQCRKAKKPITTFCAITVGVPNPAEGDVKVALKGEQIHDLRLVVPVMDPSKGSLERKEVKETQTFYKVLDSANGCSLLQLQPMTVFRDQLPVQCTLKFSPILGDHTYSSRVAKVLGKDVYIPFDAATPQTQRVEEKILRKMHFSSQQMHRMPLHLHLHKLVMPEDPQGRYPTHLQAPPPPFFQRTMELLRLRMKV